MFHEPRHQGNSSRKQDPAVANFYSAVEHRSLGALWPSFALARIFSEGNRSCAQGELILRGDRHRFLGGGRGKALQDCSKDILPYCCLQIECNENSWTGSRPKESKPVASRIASIEIAPEEREQLDFFVADTLASNLLLQHWNLSPIWLPGRALP